MKIEFRGKSDIEELEEIGIEHNNGWVYGSYVDGFIVIGDRKQWSDVDPKTVGQYTNVNTPDGKKIFEDDYVLVKDCHPTGYDDFYGVVEFLEGAWWVDNELMQKAVLLWNESNEIEILGNIHDNPELLEVPK